MHFSVRYLTPLAVAAGAAIAIAAAPTAAASPLTCTDVGSATQCVSLGNSQITANVPVVQRPPQIIIIHRNRW
ncbi:hypothetical protein [Mycobacterium antarcticum]|uniref:hypothetical protein n=1 Tax=Mycolicibacterium sp. TUM20984 TaxID=3023368 RepID=UPI0023A083D9|nr:hypothetical protein [Mycolicibacterium sp. TUM20984]GLP81201.1 hypothetical protein TUM20984_26210 [Mycolicibacterium sp. TUM20984]